MDDKITITTGTLLSLSSGRMLAENGFGDIQAAADVILGQPTMTHMFASQHVADRLEREAKVQHPWTADEDAVFENYPDLSLLTREETKAAITYWLEIFIYPVHGRECVIESEQEPARISFFEGLPSKSEEIDHDHDHRRRYSRTGQPSRLAPSGLHQRRQAQAGSVDH